MRNGPGQSDISTLAGNPSSAAQGETVLADAQSVTGSFQSAAGAINSSIADSSQTLQQSVSSANNLLDQLATINKSLALAPNDPNLLDQQQAALNSLSSLISVNAMPQADGSVILASGGTVLLDQSGAQTINVLDGNGSTPPSLAPGITRHRSPRAARMAQLAAASSPGRPGRQRCKA